jgi:hypothetical protein
MRICRIGKRIYVQRVPLDTSWFCPYCCATVETEHSSPREASEAGDVHLAPNLELTNEDVGIARHQIGNITHSLQRWSSVPYA